MAWTKNPFTDELDNTGNWGDVTLYFIENGDTLELWWNGSLVQTWTVASSTGRRMGPWLFWMGI